MSKTYIFGHKNPDTDSITSTLVMENFVRKAGDKEAKGVRLGNLNKETKYVFERFGYDVPELIQNLDGVENVVLVDHNEFNQSADGIENVNIKCVVDHHRIDNFKTAEPLFYRAAPVGCTATVLYGMYKEHSVEIDKKIATLMLSAIISDTLLFKSPTCTEIDIQVAKELEKISGLNAQEYGLELLKAGTDLSDLSAKELINIDSKEFEFGNIKARVCQINTASIPDLLKRLEDIKSEIKSAISDNSLGLFVAMVTDIIENNSQVIVLGNNADIFEKSFNIKLDQNNSVFLPGVVSRKKQIIPVLTKAI